MTNKLNKKKYNFLFLYYQSSQIHLKHLQMPMLTHTSYPSRFFQTSHSLAEYVTLLLTHSQRGSAAGVFILAHSIALLLLPLFPSSDLDSAPSSLLSKQYSFTLLWHCCSPPGHGQCFQTRGGCEIITPLTASALTLFTVVVIQPHAHFSHAAFIRWVPCRAVATAT